MYSVEIVYIVYSSDFVTLKVQMVKTFCDLLIVYNFITILLNGYYCKFRNESQWTMEELGEIVFLISLERRKLSLFY